MPEVAPTPASPAQHTGRLLGLACIAGVFGTAAWFMSPDSSTAAPITQRSLGDRNPRFWLSENTGARGDVVLGSVDFGAGLVYRNFIYAESISDFQYTGHKDGMRVIAGPDTATDAQPAMLCGLDGDWSSVSSQDKADFNAHCTAAFQNANLNHYVALDKSGAEFSLIVNFDREIRDNDPADDPIPELLYFERGAGGGNSSLTVEAIDADGNALGTPTVIAPEDGVHTTPTNADVALLKSSSSMDYRGHQTMTCVAVDLSALGVESTTRLRLRTPRSGDSHTDGRPFKTGEKQPDFKLVAVQTYEVAIPSAFIGD